MTQSESRIYLCNYRLFSLDVLSILYECFETNLVGRSVGTDFV